MPYSSFELLDRSKPILVFGRDGQVGKALQVYLHNFKLPVVFLGRSECDLSDELAIRVVLNRFKPQLIINAAAYTAVDKAESEQTLAFAINANAPKIMAQYIASVSHGILVHYSTDYVFADSKKTVYLETDLRGPVERLCVYGQSKLEGEQAIEKVFKLAIGSKCSQFTQKKSRYLILRTSWVYGDGANFISTILRLAGEKNILRVVADQVGVPTSAKWLAEVSLQLADSKFESGIYHAVPDGEASWHSLAVFAIQLALKKRENIKVKLENILPIPAKDFPLPAKRPYNSRLSNSKLKQALSKNISAGEYPNWKDQVQEYIKNHLAKLVIG